jgi:hypothetical protein
MALLDAATDHHAAGAGRKHRSSARDVETRPTRIEFRMRGGA